jgi:hypothetical protein
MEQWRMPEAASETVDTFQNTAACQEPAEYAELPRKIDE